MSDYSAPQYSNQPSLSMFDTPSYDSQPNQTDAIRQQQESLKNLQEQRKQLEALNSSFNSHSSGSSNLLDFTDNSAQTVPLTSASSTQANQINQQDVLNRLSSFMRNVESKLELLGNSMRQLDLDIQLSSNKQDRHIEQMSTSVNSLETQVRNLKQQVENTSSVPERRPTNEFQRQEFTAPSPQRQVQTSPEPSNSGSMEKPTCPVCSQSFSPNDIHAHIESHFNEGSQVRMPQQTEQEQNTGFWSKIFKKKDESQQQPQPQPQQQPQGEIRPPTYNYSSGLPNNPPTAIPAFYSPTGTVQYQQPQPNQGQAFYPQGYAVAPRN
mmetsp:Transcript_66560/g.100304  ORF Transcript_66560/g.100304 Transcript_66560/m.100304 type:complete len:324 (+) Transcript_66560:30-1001(+)